MQANKKNLVESAHDISDGGMLVALTECLIGTEFGADIGLEKLGNLSLNAKLFAESHSRFIVSVKPENKMLFEDIFKDKAFLLGQVSQNKRLIVKDNNHQPIDVSIKEMEASFSIGF